MYWDACAIRDGLLRFIKDKNISCLEKGGLPENPGPDRNDMGKTYPGIRERVVKRRYGIISSGYSDSHSRRRGSKKLRIIGNGNFERRKI